MATVNNAKGCRTEISGQISFRRPLSSRLVFFDLACSSGIAEDVFWVELIVKVGNCLSPQDVRNMRDSVKLGDTVRAIGQYEYTESAARDHDSNGATFIVEEIQVLTRWRDRSPTTPFVPRRAPNPGANGVMATVVAVSVACTATAETIAAGASASITGSIRVAEQAAEGFNVSASSSSRSTSASVCQDVAREVDVDNGAEASAPAVKDCVLPAASEQRHGGMPAGTAYCNSGDGSRPLVCKYWAATGRCPKGGGIDGGTCQYDHPPGRRGASGVQQLYMWSRRSERLAAASELGFVHETGDAAKRHRAAVFCEWLVQTYGRDFLNSGTGVLDVAGGRGALTFHLLLRCGVRATLVEPRPAKWSRSQHREVQVAAAAAAMPPLAPGELTLPQLRRRIEPALWRYGAGGVGSDSGCGGGDDDEDTVRKLLLGCSMVVGLHPDQATEAILDFALECGKPFALVPCCVFPRLFPNRRLLLLPPPSPDLSPPPLPLQKRTGAEPEGLHAQTLLLTSLSKPQLLAPPPSSNSSYSSYSTASVADPFPAQWVPVETYSQLLSYILQRAQLYGGWGNSTCREGSGGGGGRGENHHPLSMTSWWRHQEVWLQLWRLASGGSKQGKVVQSPDQVRSRGLRPVRNPYPGPNQNLDLRPDSDSDWGLHLEHDSCLEATVELRSRYSQQLVSGQVPPRSSCTFTLRWLEEQAERWERDVGAGPVSPAATITTAADDAGSKRQNHAEPEANLASEALAPSLAAVRSAGTATGDMPPLRDCRRESGMGKGMYWDINVTGSNAGIEGAGCWKANLSRSLGSGEPAVTRLMFQGANQVVYRLPSVLVDVVT